MQSDGRRLRQMPKTVPRNRLAAAAAVCYGRAMRERVRLKGVVRGEGPEATCTISAAQISLPGAAGVSETTDWVMLDVSEPLPDGNYEILADGKREQVRLVNGQWLSRGF